MTIRQQIRDKVVTKLNTSRPVNVPECSRGKWTPDEPLRSGRMGVYFHDEEDSLPEGRHSALVDRQLRIAVQCAHVSNDPEALDDLVEPMLAWASKNLEDWDLDGLSLNVSPHRVIWERARLDAHYISATVVFIIYFQTDRGNLEAVE